MKIDVTPTHITAHRDGMELFALEWTATNVASLRINREAIRDDEWSAIGEAVMTALQQMGVEVSP